MKLRRKEKKEKKPNKVWIFIKKLLVVFISGIIVITFFVSEPGLRPLAPVLLGIYVVLTILLWIKSYQKPVRKFLIILFLLYGIPTIALSYKAHRFLKYTKEEHKDDLNSFLLDAVYKNRDACFEHYEKEMLGIRNNKALSGTAVSQHYLNQIDGRKIYQNEEDQKLIVEKKGRKTFTSSKKVGEIIADIDQVFFINIDENNQLERLDLKTNQFSIVMKDSIEKFAVLGDEIIVLNSKGEMYRLQWKNNEKKKLANYVQTFYVGKKLFVQNSTQIVSMSYDGDEQERIEKNAALKGYQDGKVYYISLDSKKNKSGEEYVLYEKDVDLDEEKIAKKSKTPIQSIY